ncbi:MAG: universal stress protein [Acidimicrobiales bacterium]|nr:universal stress protein [Acidimicrobiales bacterium]
MFTEVIIPFDETVASLRAVPVGAAVASRLNVGAIAVTVAPSLTTAAGMEASAQRWIEANGLPEVKVASVVSGSPVYQALQTRLGEGHPLIVVATATHPHSRPVVGGSVAEDLVHYSPPGYALLVGPSVAVGSFSLDGSLMACIDTEVDPGPFLAPMTELVTALALDPILVTVMDLAQTPMFSMGRTGQEPVPVESVALQHAAYRLASLGTSAPECVTLFGGDRVETVVDYARISGVSALMVASRDRGGISRLVFGSAALQIVQNATVPVFVVHREV